jgi:nucleoside-diphosphate-sugar epimerase
MNKNQSNLPVLVISGASGFVGKYFLNAFCKDYFIYALARRPQQAADVSFNKNIFWIRVDIADKTKIQGIFKKISSDGDVDFFLHLAGHFGFRNNKKNSEYERTNVIGTKNILESAHHLNFKRFIFSSSLALHKISDPNRIITEDTIPDATTQYSKTKIKAEELIKTYSSNFPCTTIRFAAIFSDWCEHPPLYSFLSTWLSKRWDRRILVGKGKTAIPYLHIYDLIELYKSIFLKTESLPQFHNLIADPNHHTSHKQLFKVANNYNYHYDISPFYLPKYITLLALAIRNFGGYLINKTYFEQLWMLKYTDCIMNVDASHTHKLLAWEPTKRYSISRRLLFLIWKMKTNPIEWHRKNKIRFYAIVERQYLKIYDAMLKLRDQIVEIITKRIMSEKNAKTFTTYQKLGHNKLKHRVQYIYKMLEFDICTGDRSHILDYAKNLGEERYIEGFPAQEVINAVKLCAEVIVNHLVSEKQLRTMKHRIFDEIMLTLQMVIDEIEDTYENLSKIS